MVLEVKPAGFDSLHNQGLAWLKACGPSCQGNGYPGSVAASFRSLLSGPIEWVLDLEGSWGVKPSALFQLLSDRLGQPVVLIPGGGNSNTPVKGFTLASCFNEGCGRLSQIMPFAFMETAQLIELFQTLGNIASGHEPDGPVVVGWYLAPDILEFRKPEL